ncbi:hypothetical protein O181_045867 [Austropuccinia psidii MF-1]|uniref:Uncharacterized protein n=1 Tax=Austropuccinia psidii MF-1 TaxID=1389203 RepID=A0A9Q3DQ66_9BASI|nr:hypothetical protein [Austropuccinia psidii MF-1]
MLAGSFRELRRILLDCSSRLKTGQETWLDLQSISMLTLHSSTFLASSHRRSQMSILGMNTPTSPNSISQGPSPILKRLRSSHHDSNQKRRRTSPSGAFSRLSISPPNNLSCPIRYTSNQSTFDPSNKSSPVERKMKSVYSAYEIERDRIFIESLSDGGSSPSRSNISEENEKLLIDHQDNLNHQLQIDPSISHSISSLNHPDQSLKLVLQHHQNSSSIVEENLALNQSNQLVLYQEPCWKKFLPVDLNLIESHPIDPIKIETIEEDEQDNPKFNEMSDDEILVEELNDQGLESMELD